jgi:predicted 3-demethylubiquinone-9 3-methyltransferase (glyoxalase superfamily)
MFLLVDRFGAQPAHEVHTPGATPLAAVVVSADVRYFSFANDSSRPVGYRPSVPASAHDRTMREVEGDRYWEALSAVPEAEQCGWLKDRFGLSWQIVPAAMDEMMTKGSPEQIARVTQAFLKMKKFDLADLQRAYAGA